MDNPVSFAAWLIDSIYALQYLNKPVNHLINRLCSVYLSRVRFNNNELLNTIKLDIVIANAAIVGLR